MILATVYHAAVMAQDEPGKLLSEEDMAAAGETHEYSLCFPLLALPGVVC